MKVLRNWNDLEPYGFDVLTGEASAFMPRLLVDVTDQARQILGEMLGFVHYEPNRTVRRMVLGRMRSSNPMVSQADMSCAIDVLDGSYVRDAVSGGMVLPENWNSGKDKTGCIMMPTDMFYDVAVWCLGLAEKCPEIWETYDGVYGLDPDDDYESVQAHMEYMRKASEPRWFLMRHTIIPVPVDESGKIGDLKHKDELIAGPFAYEHEAWAHRAANFPTESDPLVAFYLTQQGERKRFRHHRNHGYTRNTHKMSGRTE